MFDVSIHAYLRASATDRAARVGGFLALFDEHDAGRYFNYAIPDDASEPGQEEIAELVTAFRNRSRLPRLEYLPGACPAVAPALRAAGFVTEARVPILTCAPRQAAAPAVPGIRVLLAETEEQLWQAACVQAEAYRQPAAGEHDVARLRRTIDHGGLVAVAVTDAGVAVGAGQLGPANGGFSELAAVGVRRAFRRSGIAAALVAELTRTAPTVGATTPFLMTVGDAEERVYQRVGYRRATEMLHISLP